MSFLSFWFLPQFLLSSSVDKTVRLWQVGCDKCLRIFSHNNYGELFADKINVSSQYTSSMPWLMLVSLYCCDVTLLSDFGASDFTLIVVLLC